MGELNKNLDRAAPVEVVADITRIYEQEHRGRRGRRYYTYHIDIDLLSESPFEIPLHIEISHKNYRALSEAKKVRLSIGRGYLDYPWYRALEPADGPSR